MGKKRGPMSQETKDKISAAAAKKRARKETFESPIEVATEATVGLSHEPTIVQATTPHYGIASVQPIVTKREALVFRGVPIGEQDPEPAFDGMYWKATHEDINERGWCLVKMFDGSWNVVEHRGEKE